MSVLKNLAVREALLLAWKDSNPGTPDAHEEGGFVLRQTDGSFRVERWPRGAQDEIRVPLHPGGKFNGTPIVATFHTHPNTGPEFLQEPGPTDIRAVRSDPDLGHAEYEGEFVISAEFTYLIKRSGAVTVVGPTDKVLANS